MLNQGPDKAPDKEDRNLPTSETSDTETVFTELKALHGLKLPALKQYVEETVQSLDSPKAVRAFTNHLLPSALSKTGHPEEQAVFERKMTQIAVKMLAEERDELNKLRANAHFESILVTADFAFDVLVKTLPLEAKSKDDKHRHQAMSLVIEMLSTLEDDAIYMDEGFDLCLVAVLFDIAAKIEEIDEELTLDRNCGTIIETQDLAVRWLSRCTSSFLQDNSSYVVESCAELLASHPDDEVVEELREAVKTIATNFLVADMDPEILVDFAMSYAAAARALGEIQPSSEEQKKFWLNLWGHQSLVSTEALFGLSKIHPAHAAYIFMCEIEGAEGSFLTPDEMPETLFFLLKNEEMHQPLAKVLAALGEPRAKSLLRDIAKEADELGDLRPQDVRRQLRPFAALVLRELEARAP